MLFLVLLAAVAFLYTTPWDNYLVKHEVWTYGADRVSHVIGYVPIEEYTFFILQPLVTGLLYLILRNRSKPSRELKNSGRTRLIGGLLVAAITVAILWERDDSFVYLRLIIGWSLPVIAAQWLLGGDYFLQRARTWLAAVTIPTLYFAAADRFAILNGIWDITLATSTGIKISGLPLEEFLFFLLTNVLVVQGLMLFLPDPPDHFSQRLSKTALPDTDH
jgi:lycopene cyclase domain-containing protein